MAAGFRLQCASWQSWAILHEKFADCKRVCLAESAFLGYYEGYAQYPMQIVKKV